MLQNVENQSFTSYFLIWIKKSRYFLSIPFCFGQFWEFHFKLLLHLLSLPLPDFPEMDAQWQNRIKLNFYVIKS